VSAEVNGGELAGGNITTADLYRKLEDMSNLMIRLEERVSVLPDHEARLRLLERFRYTLLGVSVTAGAAAGILSSVISALAQRHG
jgi:hypothetical protein